MSDARPRGPIEPLDPTGEPLLRQMTAVGIWALAINGVIGAGIFGTPGAAAAETGIYSPLVFLLCGLLLAPIVLTFAQVASSFSGTGGPVLYAHAAFGPFAGFQVGWAYYITRIAASAANVSLLVAAVSWFAPALESGPWRIALLFLVCGALTLVNVVGTRAAMRSVGFLTAFKMVPLLLLVGYGVTRIDPSVFDFGSAPVPSMGQFGTAVMLLVYSYVGWETAVVPAGEARDPARDMPRALLWTLAFATVLYVAIQTVSVGVLPGLANTAERPLVAVGRALFGAPGALLLTVGVVVSVGGNVASAAMSTPRVTYALARAGMLPAVFAAVSRRFRTPAWSIVVYGLLMFALAATGTFVELAKISVMARLLIYLAGVLAALRLPPGPMRLPGGRLFPTLGAVVCLGLLAQVGAGTALRTLLYLSAGTVLYAVARSRAG